MTNTKYTPIVEDMAPGLTDYAKVVDLAATVEEVAQDTYLANLAMLEDGDQRQLMASPEDEIAEQVPCGPDVDAHVQAVQRFLDAGFTDVAVVQIGGDSQGPFLDWAETELLPALRRAT